MKTYKVGIIPGTITEIGVEDPNITVTELFALAGLTIDSGHTIRRNGETISVDSTVGAMDTGTSFYASKKIKGN